MNTKIVLALPLLLCSLSQGAYLKPLRQMNKLAKQIQSPRHSHPEVEQLKLLEQFKKTDIPRDKRALPLIENIMSALAHKKTFPQLSENADLLVKATQAFCKISGFNDTFKKTVSSAANEGSFKGNMYELEHALAITEAVHPQTILGFGIIMQYKKMQREFDIVTDKSCIECKNISWFYKKNKKKLQCQFLEQQKLVNFYNRITKQAAVYRVVSKQPIPANWQEWFKKQNISIS